MINLDIQHETKATLPVTDKALSIWVEAALKAHVKQAELTLRLVDKTEIQMLNLTYRKQDKPTNVLAFPANLPEDISNEYPLLGDVIVCPAILEEESKALNTDLNAHWAHIVIHGVLHLLGFDHIDENDARIMQKYEISVLKTLGFDTPYLHGDGSID